MGYLRTAAEERGLTAVISLHQVNLARKFGQRFIGLRDGKKVFDGYHDEMTIEVVDEIYGDIDTEGMLAQTSVDSGGDDESGGSSSRFDRPTGGRGRSDERRLPGRRCDGCGRERGPPR